MRLWDIKYSMILVFSAGAVATLIDAWLGYDVGPAILLVGAAVAIAALIDLYTDITIPLF